MPQKMIRFSDFLDFNSARFQKPKKNLSEDQELAGEIFEYFGRQIPFGRLMKMVKEKGKQAIRETFIETQKCDFPHKLPLFLKKCAEMKVIWQ